MYFDPFVTGILLTIFLEFTVVGSWSIVYVVKDLKAKDKKTKLKGELKC